MNTTAPAPANPRAAIMERARQVAQTIKQQITPGVLMSLGCHDAAPTVMDAGSPGLFFRARILAMKADGTRSAQARNMGVFVWLTGDDRYSIRVGYIARGRYVTHYEETGVYAEQLHRIMLALDYDGDTILNPRHL